MTMTHVLVIFIIGVFLAEILSGRHKNIYTLKDFYITGGSFIITRLITGPLVAFGIAQLLAFALPNQAGTLRNAVNVQKYLKTPWLCQALVFTGCMKCNAF